MKFNYLIILIFYCTYNTTYCQDLNGTFNSKELRKKSVVFDSVKHKQVLTILYSIIGKDFDKNKNTMIHLFSENSESLKDGIKNRKYWKWIKRNSKSIQSFLISSNESNVLSDKNKYLYNDSRDFLKKTFFSNSEFKINHIYIKTDGEILLFYGYEDILYVLDSSV